MESCPQNVPSAVFPEVKIYNTAGNLVYQNIFDVNRLRNHAFTTRNWASGIYFVQLSNKGKYYISEQAIR